MSGSVLERTEARNLMETMGGIEAGGTQENLNKFLGSWTLSVGAARPTYQKSPAAQGVSRGSPPLTIEASCKPDWPIHWPAKKV